MKVALTSKPRSPLVQYSPMMRDLRALSVAQPWAWLICGGFKDVENRSWRTSYRGPLLIHAGMKVRSADAVQLNGIVPPEELQPGGIVGIADLVDCLEESSSPWFDGTGYGWVLRSPRQLRFRKCKGSPGLFRPQFPER